MHNYLKTELYKLIKDEEFILDFIQKGPMDGLLFLDLENKENYWMSPRLWEILGYKDRDQQLMPWSSVIYEEDEARLDKSIEQYKTKTSFMLDLRFHHCDGHCVTIESRNLLFLNDSEPRRMMGAMHILSASTEAQLETLSQIKALQSSEEKYKAMYVNAPLAFQSLDEDGTIVDVNHQWLRSLGYDKDEVLGYWFGDFLHPDNVVYFKESFPRFKKQGYINDVQFRMKKKSGDFIYASFEGCIGYTPDGKFRRTYCTFKDITQERRAYQSLEENEQKLRLAIDNSPLGICIIDREGRFVSSNKAFEKIVQYSTTELSHMTFYDITHPDFLSKNQNFFKEFVDNKTSTFSIDKKYMRKDGTTVDVRLHIGAIQDKQQNTTCAMTFVEDITWQKESEKQLIAAKEKAEESNRLKSEFLHNMSHEIRTPMNGILGFSEMLTDPMLTNEKRQYFTSIIKNSSHQLLRIIDDILDISILETKQVKLNVTQVNINDLFLELFSVFDIKAKERRIPIYLNKPLDDDDAYITTDVSKLNKILSNLIENALKFTTDGFIELAYYKEADQLIFTVKDTGSGISSKSLKRIFERFSQESKDIAHTHGGLGLGLSIAKENAQLLGGDIWVESKKGVGSTFFVSIPYVAEDLARQQRSKKTAVDVKKDGRYQILVAEDEEINMLYLETILVEMKGVKLEIYHAKNGKEAVEMSKVIKHLDLVLMDIKMPVMNGYDAALRIKEDFPDVPIIAETAYSTESDTDYALTHGCDDFISKPIEKEKLYKLIRKYLHIDD